MGLQSRWRVWEGEGGNVSLLLLSAVVVVVQLLLLLRLLSLPLCCLLRQLHLLPVLLSCLLCLLHLLSLLLSCLIYLLLLCQADSQHLEPPLLVLLRLLLCLGQRLHVQQA